MNMDKDNKADNHITKRMHHLSTQRNKKSKV